MTMIIRKEQNLIYVESDFWIAGHDTTKGGALVSVVFKKGRNGNILAAPLAMDVGPYSDIHEANPGVTIRECDDEARLLFTGTLRDAHGAGQILYAQEWRYRFYGAHRAQQIYQGEQRVDPREVCVARCRWAPHYRRLLVTSPRQSWHDGLQDAVNCPQTPASFGVFSDTGEGLQFIRGDDLTTWGFNPRTLCADYGEFVSRPAADSYGCELMPLKRATLREHGTEKLSFDSFLGITNYKSRPYLPFREVVVCSQPFPSDEEIKTLHDLGVNVLRIHEGSNFVNNTNDCWLDGVFPPYVGAQLSEMKRLIRTAHMYGIKVIPYFMPMGVHPLSPAFREHIREWQSSGAPNQVMRFSAVGDGQVWETYLCLESQWHNWLLEHIMRVVEEYGFDGVYLDGTGALGPCFHPDHARVPHAREEAVINLLLALRRRLPGKLLFHHQQTCDVNLIHANIVDHIINFEEHGWRTIDEMRPLPFGLVAQRACASVSPTPQLFLPKDGEPVSPALAFVKYKAGKGPTPSRAFARRGFPYFLVHGAVPYIYTFMEKAPLGYNTNLDKLRDEEGFYYFYRLLKALPTMPGTVYFAPEEQPLRANHPSLELAVLKSATGLLILLTNTGKEARQNVALESNPLLRDELQADSWQAVKLLVATRPASCAVTRAAANNPQITISVVDPDELYILDVTF